MISAKSTTNAILSRIDTSAATTRGRLLDDFSIEATPAQLRSTGSLANLLAPATRVYVPYLPRAPLSDGIEACRRLSAQGFTAVPHLSARAMRSRDSLDEHLARLAEAGAGSLLLIAGDRRRPAGPFRSTLDILETGLLGRHGFCRVGVAGHPEGHPAASEPELMNALAQKAAYARESGTSMWVVTQFGFSAAPVTRWLERLRGEGIHLPVCIGIPGPAKAKTLLRFALQCGVAASSRMLASRPDAVTRLAGTWTPDAMLAELARHPESARAGIHVFPFGGLGNSLAYLGKLR